jgi:hypothetical protein
VNDLRSGGIVSAPEVSQGDAGHEQHHDHHGGARPAGDPVHRDDRAGWAGVRDALGAAVGSTLGLLPHLLHHVSLFAGALVITGAAGNLLFGALGLLLSVPLLRRLHRRFGTWKAPALALAAFAAMFSLSAFVIGPALGGADADATPTPPASDTPEPGTPSGSVEHDTHHGD